MAQPTAPSSFMKLPICCCKRLPVYAITIPMLSTMICATVVKRWSTTWNYGPGWSGPLLQAYGVKPDPRRLAYYRLLWDLAP